MFSVQSGICNRNAYAAARNSPRQLAVASELPAKAWRKLRSKRATATNYTRITKRLSQKGQPFLLVETTHLARQGTERQVSECHGEDSRVVPGPGHARLTCSSRMRTPTSGQTDRAVPYLSCLTTVRRRSEMARHKLPFENRQANGKQAWEWHCQLERIGLHNVRAMLANHESEHPDRPFAVADVPTPFVRDWLAFHDRHAARQQILWRASVIALTCIAAAAAVVAALR